MKYEESVIFIALSLGINIIKKGVTSMFRLKKNTMFALALFMILSISCKKKNNGVTDPGVSNFKTLVANKTYVWEDKEIIFNENSFPFNLVANDGLHNEKDSHNNEITLEIKTKIYSFSENRIIYEQIRIVRNKETGAVIDEILHYIGYELRSSGNLLYKTSHERAAPDDVDWDSVPLVGILKNKRLPLEGNWSEMANIKGYFVSTHPYINSELDEIYYGIEIGRNPGDMYLALAGKTDNIINTLDAEKRYGDFGTINSDKYLLKDVSKSYIYKGDDNHFIVLIYVESKDAYSPFYRYYNVFDFVVNKDNSITLFFDKETGVNIVLEQYK